MGAVSPQIVQGFRAVAAASVSDAVDRVVGRRGFMSATIKPVFPAAIVGPAATVLEGPGPDPGPPIHALEAIDKSPPGTVIVIGTEDPGPARDVAWRSSDLAESGTWRETPSRCSPCSPRESTRWRAGTGSARSNRFRRRPKPGPECLGPAGDLLEVT
jgi:hypothetical protein